MAKKRLSYDQIAEPKLLEPLIKELLAVKKVLGVVGKDLKKTFTDFHSVVKNTPPDSYKNVQKIEKATEAAVIAAKEGIKVNKEVERLEKRLAEARSDEAKKVFKLQAEIAKVTKERKAEAKASVDQEDAYKKLTRQTNEAQRAFKRLAAEFGTTSDEALEARKEFLRLDEQLRAVNEAARDGRRDVGSYSEKIVEAFNRIKGKKGEGGGGVLGLTGAFNFFKTGGLLAVGAVVSMFGKLRTSLATNSAAMLDFNKLTSRISITMNTVVGRVWQWVRSGRSLRGMFEDINKRVEAGNKALELRVKLVNEEIALAKIYGRLNYILEAYTAEVDRNTEALTARVAASKKGLAIALVLQKKELELAKKRLEIAKQELIANADNTAARKKFSEAETAYFEKANEHQSVLNGLLREQRQSLQDIAELILDVAQDDLANKIKDLTAVALNADKAFSGRYEAANDIVKNIEKMFGLANKAINEEIALSAEYFRKKAEGLQSIFSLPEEELKTTLEGRRKQLAEEVNVAKQAYRDVAAQFERDHKAEAAALATYKAKQRELQEINALVEQSITDKTSQKKLADDLYDYYITRADKLKNYSFDLRKIFKQIEEEGSEAFVKSVIDEGVLSEILTTRTLQFVRDLRDEKREADETLDAVNKAYRAYNYELKVEAVNEDLLAEKITESSAARKKNALTIRYLRSEMALLAKDSESYLMLQKQLNAALAEQKSYTHQVEGVKFTAKVPESKLKKLTEKSVEALNKVGNKIEETEESVDAKEKSAAVTAASLLTTTLKKRVSDRQKAIDEELSAEEKRINKLEELAARGNEDAEKNVAVSEKRAAQLRLQKEKELRDAQRTELAIAAIQAYAGAIQKGKTGGAALAETIANISVLRAFIQTLPSFAEGVEDTGTVSKPIDRKGGRLAVLHDNERVLTKEQNLKVGAFTNNELADLALKERLGGNSPDLTPQLLNQMRSLENTIKNRPVYLGADFDEVAKSVAFTIKKGNKIERLHKRKGGIWG